MKNIQAQNAEMLVQRNLNAYNAKEIKAFMAEFTDDTKLIILAIKKLLQKVNQKLKSYTANYLNNHLAYIQLF